jgi:YD repeat-containing protein
MVDTWDAVGRKTVSLRDTERTTYTYDNADRLVSQTLAGALTSFTMDAVGNVTVKHQQGTNPLTMVYDAANRLMTIQSGGTRTTNAYDSNGNLTSENAAGVRTTYTWDRENRLRNVNANGSLSTYTFDGDGLRRSRHEAGGSLTTTIWDGSDYLGEY